MKRVAIGKLYANDEEITSFGIPDHPTDGTIVFLSTLKSLASYDETSREIIGSWTSVNRLYAYDWKDGELQVIYEETAPTIIRTRGMDGSRLIVERMDVDWSPGPCAGSWTGTMEYLELADIAAGLKPYAVPRSVLDQDAEDTKDCVDEGFY